MKKATVISGILSVSGQGYGFIDTKESSLFIPPGMLGGAISGDEVEAVVDPQSDPARPSGAIKRVFKRHLTDIVGCLVPYYKGWALRPLRHELPSLIPLSDDSCRQARPAPREGNWAMAVLPVSEKGDKLRGELKSVLESSGDVSADLDAIVGAFGLPAAYTAQEELAASKLQPVKIRRVECRHQCIVTIDPVDARDYDDALSCEIDRKSGYWVVGVHIADVACYVQPGTPLDTEAANRGFTSYLPGRTIPMLPRALANDLCSLKAGVERFAHTVYITIDPSSGEILKWQRQHTVITVTQRLCYDQVQRYIDGEEFEEAAPGVCELINRLHHIAELLRRRRSAVEHFLPMAMPEIRAVCSENPSALLGVKTSEENPSHHLVEEFMLAANQCVAQELLQKNIPGLFRNHAAPEAEKMAEFAKQAAEMMRAKVPAMATRSQVVSFLRQAEKSPLKTVLYMTFLRNLPRADYGIDSLGHFGLGKEFYSHFTSPIRRYSDLLVHRQLLMRDGRRKVLTRDQLAPMAARICAQEFNCDSAQFAAEDRMKIRYIKKLADENPQFVVTGQVCHLAKSGLSLYLAEYGLMAFIAGTDLPRGWLFDAARLQWKNIHDGTVFQMATALSCRVWLADAVRGELRVIPSMMPDPPIRRFEEEAFLSTRDRGEKDERQERRQGRSHEGAKGGHSSGKNSLRDAGKRSKKPFYAEVLNTGRRRRGRK